MKYVFLVVAFVVSAQFAFGAGSACQPVDGDKILGRDLAAAEPRLTIADPDQVVGFAPEPGAKRVFWPAELSHIASKNGLSIDEPLQQLCFERRMRAITNAEILEAIRAWAPESAEITIVEQSNGATPAGSLMLPRPTNTHSAPDGSVVLRGYVLYGSDHRFPFWARARFHVDREVIVPTEDIPAGAEVRAEQLTSVHRSEGIDALQEATDASQVVGRNTVRRLTAGSPILLTSLLKPKQVNSGAIVRVDVLNGALHLALEGRAESGGRIGDMIMIRNPSSGKAFQAQITGENAAVVKPHGFYSEGKNTR